MSYEKVDQLSVTQIGEVTSLNKFSDNLEIIRSLSHGYHEIFLVNNKTLNQDCVIKIFPQQVPNQPSENFLKELRVKDLNSPNVIKILDYEIQTEIIINNQPVISSYILMEYAPYKDLLNLISKEGSDIDDVFIRTLFHEIVKGIEYLHSEGIYHLDIKLENILIGENFQLKIADFDNCYKMSDGRISFRGTECSRAIEIARGKCQDPSAADIYSMGVILFALKTGGTFPHTEGKNIGKINLYNLLENKPEEFWIVHSLLLKKSSEYFDNDFKNLFMSMVEKNPQKRATIADIKNSAWFKKEIYSKDEMIQIMKKKLLRDL